MAHRKLVQQGNSTLMVSLPAHWVKENKLLKGSTINLEQTPAGLIIHPHTQNLPSTITIELKEHSETALRMLLTNLYRRGYDKIELASKTTIPTTQIASIIKTNFIGIDIAASTKRSCLLENITEPDAAQFENIIQKVFFNTKLLLQTTIDRIQKTPGSESYLEIEERLRKYDNFARRVLSKRSLSTSNIEYLWTFLSLLNHAQRQLYHLNRAIDQKYTFSTKVSAYCKELLTLIDSLQHAYAVKSLQTIENIHQQEKNLIYNKGYALLESAKGHDAIALHHLLCAVRLLYQATSPLGALILT